VEYRYGIDFLENIRRDHADADEINLNGTRVNIKNAVINAVLADIPSQPMCGGDCRGLCSMCGADLNEGGCACGEDGIDPRLSILKNIDIENGV
jgi:uncharacterized protein